MTNWNYQIKKFLCEEKVEIITIGIIAISLYFIGIGIEKYAAEHKDLATHVPLLSILAGIILFLIQLILMTRKLLKLKPIDGQTIKKRNFVFKSIQIVTISVSFLFTDYVVAHSLSMSYFAFAFNAGTESFDEAWNHLHQAEILFPILSIFSLWCLRIKQR